MARHNDTAKEWGALGFRALVPSAIAYKPKINSRTVQGERTGARARQEGGGSDGDAYTVGEAQGSRLRTVNGTARLVGQPGQVVVPAELSAEVSDHSFCKRGTTTMFDIRIVNLDTGSYLCKSLFWSHALVGARIEVENSNVEHRGGPPLPEVVGAYVCP